MVRQAFLKGSGGIAASRPLNAGCGQEKRPKTLLVRAPPSQRNALSDFTMARGHRPSAGHLAQAIEMEGKKKLRCVAMTEVSSACGVPGWYLRAYGGAAS
jgi:hypothetical protein